MAYPPADHAEMLPTIARLDRFWRDLPGSASIPHRRDVTGADMGSCIDAAFLIDWPGAGEATFRIASPFAATATPRALFVGEDRRRMAQLLARTALEPARCRVSFDVCPGGLWKAGQGQMLLLPLRSGDGAIGRIFGGLDIAPWQVVLAGGLRITGEWIETLHPVPREPPVRRGHLRLVHDAGGSADQPPAARGPAPRLGVVS